MSKNPKTVSKEAEEVKQQIEATKKAEQEVRTPPKTYVFQSKYKNAVIVMESGEPATKFSLGNKGKRIKFNDGIYKTEDKEEIEYLKQVSTSQERSLNKIAFVGVEV